MVVGCVLSQLKPSELRPTASAFFTAKNVVLLGLYPIRYFQFPVQGEEPHFIKSPLMYNLYILNLEELITSIAVFSLWTWNSDKKNWRRNEIEGEISYFGKWFDSNCTVTLYYEKTLSNFVCRIDTSTLSSLGTMCHRPNYTVDLVIYARLNFREFLILVLFTKFIIREFFFS